MSFSTNLSVELYERQPCFPNRFLRWRQPCIKFLAYIFCWTRPSVVADKNKMAFDKTWIVLIAGCGVLGLAFWGGMNAMTLKMTLLWLFISFGFLTLIMHLFGSPISLLLGKVLQTSSADGPCKKGILYF